MEGESELSGKVIFVKYTIMHKNEVIAESDGEQITKILNKDMSPLCFVEGLPLSYWLRSRFVDTHRSHSRSLFKALRLQSNVDVAQIIEVGHGITITDNWWIKRSEEELDYYDLKKYNEDLSDIALYGATASERPSLKGYTELGTTGSFEKAWKFHNGEWKMYKRGNMAEMLSEYYASQFLKALGEPVADYQIHRTTSKIGLEEVFVVTRDFTENAKYDFEPLCSIAGDNEEIDFVLSRLNRSFHDAYSMLIFYDALLYNGDRHNENLGMLRNSDSGELLQFAPYFDFNLSLIATGNLLTIRDDTGNIFTADILKSKECSDLIRKHLPSQNKIETAIAYATKMSQSAFPELNLQYAFIEDYIHRTYLFFKKTLDNSSEM